jgi:hypothetical protein
VKNAAEIVVQWRQRRPPHVPKEDVEAVVEAYFPTTHRYINRGSHWLIITDPMLRLAEQHGFDTGTLGGVISLSLVDGRRVKKYLIENLIDAIDVKTEMLAGAAKKEQEKQK